VGDFCRCCQAALRAGVVTKPRAPSGGKHVCHIQAAVGSVCVVGCTVSIPWCVSCVAVALLVLCVCAVHDNSRLRLGALQLCCCEQCALQVGSACGSSRSAALACRHRVQLLPASGRDSVGCRGTHTMRTARLAGPVPLQRQHPQGMARTAFTGCRSDS
jgi:hypothetical protein